MSAPFFKRLRAYYESAGAALRDACEGAAGFANNTDVGMAREIAYLEFLKRHVPSRCNVSLGGFLFDQDGSESRQLDILITMDVCPQFQLNPMLPVKTWACLEGTIACVSVKSTLNKKELIDSLDCIASIPKTRDLGSRVPPGLPIKDYDDWPYKIIFAPEA